MKNIVLTVYLKNEKIVRIKTSPFGVFAIISLFAFSLIYSTYRISSTRTPATVVEKTVEKVAPVVAAEKKEKFEIIDKGSFMVKNFEVNKVGSDSSMRFFLTSKDGATDKKKGLIKVSHLDDSDSIQASNQINEFFEFRHGRFTDVPIAQNLKKVLVQIYDSGNIVFQNVIEIKNGTFNLRAE